MLADEAAQRVLLYAVEGVTAEAGEYYAVVTNELNGTTATTETVKVTVVGDEVKASYVAKTTTIKVRITRS